MLLQHVARGAGCRSLALFCVRIAGAAAASSSGAGVGSSAASKALGLNKNSLIGARKQQQRAMLVQGKCKLCKQTVHQAGHYCQACAYKKGICAMCGKKVLDTKFYKQSAV